MNRNSDRGAVMVEYALGIALVVVVSLGALSTLRDGSSDRLEDRESAAGGSAELSGQGFTYGGTDSSGSDSGEDPPAADIVVDGVSTPASKKGSKDGKDAWIANVTVELTAGAVKVEGALVEVTWKVGTTSTTVSCPLASSKQGRVVCELASIPNDTTSVTMTVERVYGTGFSYTSPTPRPATTFNAP